MVQGTPLKKLRGLSLADAKRLGTEVLKGVRRAPAEEWGEMTARLWTMVERSYGEVRTTAQFIYRHAPKKAEQFPSLFAEIKSVKAKPEAEVVVPPDPVED